MYIQSSSAAIYTSNQSRVNFGMAAKKQVIHGFPVTMVKEKASPEEIKNIVRELKDMKFNLEFKLWRYTQKAMQTNPTAKALADDVADIDAIINELAPYPQNTLKPKA